MLTVSQVKKLFKNEAVEINMSKISVNGDIRGASGFIKHTKTNLIVYVSTENGVSYNQFESKYLYRCARNLKDYSGGGNRYANSQNELFSSVMALLSDKKHHEREFGIDFDRPPKVTVPEHKRHIAGSSAFF